MTTTTPTTRQEPEQAQSAVRAVRKPPKALFKYVVNPLMKTILRSRLHPRLSGMLMLLTFPGRKSGRRYTTPVGYHRVGDEILAFTHSPWWKNCQESDVTVLVEGKALRGHAEAVRDPDVILAAVEPLLRKYGGVRQARRLALALDPSHEPTSEELRAAIRDQGLVMIRIRPEKEGASSSA